MIVENLINLLQEKEDLRIQLKKYENEQDIRKDSNLSRQSLELITGENKEEINPSNNNIKLEACKEENDDIDKEIKIDKNHDEEKKDTNEYTNLLPQEKESKEDQNKPKPNLLDTQYGFRRQNSPNKKRLSENVFTSKKKVYKLQVDTCDNELIDPKDAYYQVDETFDPNIEIKPKKQLSTRDFQKSTTIERYLEEKLNSGNFDDILEEFQEHIKNK